MRRARPAGSRLADTVVDRGVGKHESLARASCRRLLSSSEVVSSDHSPTGRIAMLIRKLVAELLGTAVLVFFAVGTATLAFGFHLQGGSTAAGVVMTSLAF